MEKYKLNFKKLALLLLPTNFRMPMVTALFYAVMTPFNSLQVRFKQYRDEVYYALTHKPQTCHLQAVLNDEFNFEQRRITVSDIKDKPQVLTVYKRSEMSALLVPVRGWEYEEWSEGLHFMLVTRRGYGGAQGSGLLCQHQLRHVRARTHAPGGHNGQIQDSIKTIPN